MNPYQQLAIRALENMRGDDLNRAKACWRHMTPAQMKEQHGESGKSRNQILDEYQKQNAAIDIAIIWVKGARL